MLANALSVTSLNEYVRKTLAYDPMLQNVGLRGEISNFKAHSAGHWYFTLKDEKSRIACVQFRQNNMMQSFLPRDGMKVLLQGSVSLYTATGSYQFYVESMKQDGQGELYEKFLRLKEKFQEEGVFDPSRKKPLPLFPNKVGIISSRTGAVLHDIYNVSRRRCASIPLVLRPSLVQGENAANDIVQAIKELEAIEDIDVIIIARGGGNLEDLWPFNEEIVVRAIYSYEKVVVSSIGHETDYSLSDLVADVRASTPSVAAELVIPDKAALQSSINKLSKQLLQLTGHYFLQKRNALSEMYFKLSSKTPEIFVQRKKSAFLLLLQKMEMLMDAALTHRKQIWSVLENKLSAQSPKAILGRGYSIVTSEERTVHSIKQVTPNMRIRFIDGLCDVKLISAKEEDFLE